MSRHTLTLGPVLSFRGISDKGIWRVSALIACADNETQPTMLIDGRPCPAPLVLHRFNEQQFLRYDLSCGMQQSERRVEFGIADGPSWSFTMPAIGLAPRIAYVSCNGFSDPSAMRKLVRPANAVWEDLVANHDRKLRREGYLLDKEQLWHERRTHDQNLQRFHLLAMGGDQIYFDSIWEDLKPLKEWVGLSRDEQLRFEVSPALEREIEAYYFELYCKRWLPEKRRPWDEPEPNRDSADAMARIPTVMIWDDHDIFDGWGSYSCEMQHCAVFKTLFRHARRAFWLFQMQHALADLPDIEHELRPGVAKNDPLYAPISWSERLRHDPLALPLLDGQPGFSFAFQVGPLSLLVADLRTERSRTQILGPDSWRALQTWLGRVGGDAPCRYLLLMSSVPVIHPKLTLGEQVLDALGQEHVLDSNADDLKDHWAHDDHEGERKRLLETLTRVAELRRIRVAILSGDVHVAAWGIASRKDIPPSSNWAQIEQFTSSAVVHPSLGGVFERLFFYYLNQAAARAQPIDTQLKVEMMLFPGHNRYLMAARNWLALELDSDQSDGKLWASWRCEKENGFSNHLRTVEPAKAD
jgi:hypothetical protein